MNVNAISIVDPLSHKRGGKYDHYNSKSNMADPKYRKYGNKMSKSHEEWLQVGSSLSLYFRFMPRSELVTQNEINVSLKQSYSVPDYIQRLVAQCATTNEL